MKVYLVGGAVRDRLLNRPVVERDYVVVGATPQQLLDLGYQQVGKDFPVFLHPDTKEEYALARTERKSGKGYTGFSCYAAPDVTLEEDLLRRDLTVNAMAEDDRGEITDPFNGQADLAARLLRHISPAFAEDPLRVLRVARFAARYHYLGFTVADETLALMGQLADSGELAHLTPERVWSELEKAFKTDNPEVFIRVLRDCGALKHLLPEIDVLFGIPNPPEHHPEIDTGVHTLMVVQQARRLCGETPVLFAALVHDLGKAATDPARWPKHHGHGHFGLRAIEALCERLRVPNDCKTLALMVSEHHTTVHTAFELRPATVVKLFDKLDAWRKPARFEQLLLACQADSQGRLGFETSHYPQADYLRQALASALAVDIKAIVNSGLKGAAIKEELHRRRIAAVTDFKAGFKV